MYQIKIYKYLKWLFFWSAISIILFSLLYLLDVEHSNKTCILLQNKITMINILKNNTLNFLQYLLLFPIAIILIFIDICNIVVHIYVAINCYGEREMLKRLVWHGIIEYPNILLYSYLAYCNFKILYQTKNLKNNLLFIMCNKNWYILSYLLLILSAIIEGGIYGTIY